MMAVIMGFTALRSTGMLQQDTGRLLTGTDGYYVNVRPETNTLLVN